MPALSLRAASHAIHRRDLSPLELAAFVIERTRRLDPAIHAFAALDEDRVLRQAGDLTGELMRSGPRSPLHGIPVAVKDLIDVAGMPTRAGSRVLAQAVDASVDAPVVASLRSSGALVMGKTRTHEFGYGVTTPGTNNPWDPSRIAGGSSGGSAAATAARLCLASLGTDTAGSVRIPAALCGVTGLRVRRRVGSMEGIVALAPTLDSWGVLAPDATDVALVWEAALAGPPVLEQGFDATVGTLCTDALPGCDPEVAGPVEQAIDVLGDLAGGRVDVLLAPLSDWDRPANLLLMAEALEVHRRAGWFPERAEDYTEQTAGSLRYAERIDDDTLAAARASLRQLAAGWTRALERCDLIALPTCPIPAPPSAPPGRSAEQEREILQSLTRPCIPVNVCDLAAITVPCGATPGGLPVGLQLVGRDERIVLRAAIAFQEGTDHHTREPFPPSGAQAPGSIPEP